MPSKVTRFISWYQMFVSLIIILIGAFTIGFGGLVSLISCFLKYAYLGGSIGIMIIVVGMMAMGVGASLPDIIIWIEKHNE